MYVSSYSLLLVFSLFVIVIDRADICATAANVHVDFMLFDHLRLNYQTSVSALVSIVQLLFMYAIESQLAITLAIE